MIDEFGDLIPPHKLKKVCAWHDKTEYDFPVTHGICGKCSATLKAAEIVEFSLIMAGCPPFIEMMSRHGAAAILRAVRGDQNFLSYQVK